MKQYDVAFYDLVGYLVPGYLINMAAVMFVCLYEGKDEPLVAFLDLGFFFHLIFSYISGHLVQIIAKYLARWLRLEVRGSFKKEHVEDRIKYNRWWKKFQEELRAEGKEGLLRKIEEQLVAVEGRAQNDADKEPAKVSKINFRLADSQISEPYQRSRIDIFRALRGCLRALMCVFFLSGLAALVLGLVKPTAMHLYRLGLYDIRPYQVVVAGVVLLFFAYLAGVRYLRFEEKRLTEITLGLFLRRRNKSFITLRTK